MNNTAYFRECVQHDMRTSKNSDKVDQLNSKTEALNTKNQHISEMCEKLLNLFMNSIENYRR